MLEEKETPLATTEITQITEGETTRADIVQRTFFAGPTADTPQDMYCRVERGSAARERDLLTVAAFSVVSTNTYFGRFSASYWQRWTTADEVVVTALVQGGGTISICAGDTEGDSRIVSTTRVSSATWELVRLRADVDRFLDGGALWLRAQTTDDRLAISHVRWSTSSVPRRDRRSTVVICTHNRADYCVETLRALSADAETLDHIDAVYVVDQGDDLVEAHARFPVVQGELGSKLRYLRQGNLGGAGGFTRGMYETIAVERTRETHVLFMDDDIRLEPDTLIRVTKFANHTVQPVIVGGQMLCALHPDQLYADAEGIEPNAIRAGVPATEELVRASMIEYNQDRYVDPAYNAWWCCLVPPEVVDSIGLPLPLFFQWDDVEYGLRARAAGFRTVTLPGAAVWHSDFHWRAWDDWSRYFHFRNGLIVTSLHTDFDVPAVTRFLFRELLHYLISMRYGLAATMIKAVEDFLRGPQALSDGGVEVAAEIRKLRAEYPETVSQPVPEMPGLPSNTIAMTKAAGTPSRPYAVAAKRLASQLANRPKAAGFVSAEDGKWWHVSLLRTAIVTDPSQEGVRVYRLDRELMLRLARRGMRVLWRFRTHARQAQRQYRIAAADLSSFRTWKRLFKTR